MKVNEIFIDGPLIIQPNVFKDDRGYFLETYNESEYVKNDIIAEFLQDNQSKSMKGALRGLHFQRPPYAQGKLVRVIKGAVLDVVVDIRVASPTYGQHYSIELSEDNFTIFWIPEGFAHGFATLEDDTIFTYKCTDVYNKESEGGILWNDPDLNIDWGITNPVLSEKDSKNSLFKDLDSPF